MPLHHPIWAPNQIESLRSFIERYSIARRSPGLLQRNIGHIVRDEQAHQDLQFPWHYFSRNESPETVIYAPLRTGSGPGCVKSHISTSSMLHLPGNHLLHTWQHLSSGISLCLVGVFGRCSWASSFKERRPSFPSKMARAFESTLSSPPPYHISQPCSLLQLSSYTAGKYAYGTDQVLAVYLGSIQYGILPVFTLPSSPKQPKLSDHGVLLHLFYLHNMIHLMNRRARFIQGQLGGNCFPAS